MKVKSKNTNLKVVKLKETNLNKMKPKETNSREMKPKEINLKELKSKEANLKEIKSKEINLMNVILCLSVVMIHLTASPLATLRKDSIWYFILFLMNKCLCFCVPAFLFLSGFKLYNKYKEEKINIKKFFMRKNSKNCNSIYPFFFRIFYLFLEQKLDKYKRYCRIFFPWHISCPFLLHNNSNTSLFAISIVTKNVYKIR